MRYCKELGEEETAPFICLIHGKQPADHFEVEINHMKACNTCGKGFYCEDDLRKYCSVACVGEEFEG